MLKLQEKIFVLRSRRLLKKYIDLHMKHYYPQEAYEYSFKHQRVYKKGKKLVKLVKPPSESRKVTTIYLVNFNQMFQNRLFKTFGAEDAFDVRYLELEDD